jgi:hypothetical protein
MSPNAGPVSPSPPNAGPMSPSLPSAGPLSPSPPSAGPTSPMVAPIRDGAPISVDSVAPAYWLPPAVAVRILARELDGYELWLRDLAAIPAAAHAICAAPGDGDVDEPAFRLVGRGRSGPRSR